jgi:CheY-like chemotaxis protein
MRGSGPHVILVVDDEENNREVLNAILSWDGYKVMEATNGHEAVQIATKDCPDLIIMDLAMPVMDGFTAVRLLRELPQTCKVPIVACTAYDTVMHRAEAMRNGFNEFLSKPVDFAALESILNGFFTTNKPEDLIRT